MQVFLFFGWYLGLLLIASFFILGWYAITRGNWIDYPDGTRKKAGKIFKAWWFFWMKEHANPIIRRYEGEKLLSIVHDLKSINGALQIKRMWPTSVDIMPGMSEMQLTQVQLLAKRGLGVEIDFKEIKVPIEGGETTGLNMVVTEHYPNYVYPDWVRDITAGCITCHASIYGSLAFWTFHCLVRQYDLYHTIYGWVSPTFVYPTIVLTWVAFCFSLSYLLTVLWKKF